MEEKRKNIGMEILPSLHKRLKAFDLEKDMPLWAATQQAVEAYLSKESIARRGSPSYSEEHRAIRIIQQILDVEDEEELLPFLEHWLEGARARFGRKKKRRMGIVEQGQAQIL